MFASSSLASGIMKANDYMYFTVIPFSELSEQDQLRAMGIGDGRCDNYDRLCYVIDRDEQRQKLWSDLMGTNAKAGATALSQQT